MERRIYRCPTWQETKLPLRPHLKLLMTEILELCPILMWGDPNPLLWGESQKVVGGKWKMGRGKNRSGVGAALWAGATLHVAACCSWKYLSFISSKGKSNVKKKLRSWLKGPPHVTKPPQKNVDSISHLYSAHSTNNLGLPRKPSSPLERNTLLLVKSWVLSHVWLYIEGSCALYKSCGSQLDRTLWLRCVRSSLLFLNSEWLHYEATGFTEVILQCHVSGQANRKYLPFWGNWPFQPTEQ